MSERLRNDLGVEPRQHMMGLRELIGTGSPLGPATVDRYAATRESTTVGCGGPVPIRRRARCAGS